MADHKEKEAVEDVGKRTGRDPIILAAIGSVFLAWYQYYVRGNKMHGLFIGLWPPTMLAFSNAIRINDISRKVEAKSSNLLERLMQKR
jgi:tetrahydromethanopterin S-methyltransferase subunit G